MPRKDGTMSYLERVELHSAQRSYDTALNKLKMHGKSGNAYIYEAAERQAFANLMRVNAKYAGCK